MLHSSLQPRVQGILEAAVSVLFGITEALRAMVKDACCRSGQHAAYLRHLSLSSPYSAHMQGGTRSGEYWSQQNSTFCSSRAHLCIWPQRNQHPASPQEHTYHQRHCRWEVHHRPWAGRLVLLGIRYGGEAAQTWFTPETANTHEEYCTADLVTNRRSRLDAHSIPGSGRYRLQHRQTCDQGYAVAHLHT